jgi:hypothetical protein
LICLLNGGFEIHTKKNSYKMSRGVVVKNILSADDGISYVDNFDFTGIEPFTIILVDWNNQLETYELVWDGETKHFNKLPQEPKIWSSSTLYTQEMKQVRKEWFADWLLNNSSFNQDDILSFHQNEDLGTPDISLKMKRLNVETVSVTSVKKIVSEIKMDYLDFVNNSKTKQTILVKE